MSNTLTALLYPANILHDKTTVIKSLNHLLIGTQGQCLRYPLTFSRLVVYATGEV